MSKIREILKKYPIILSREDFDKLEEDLKTYFDKFFWEEHDKLMESKRKFLKEKVIQITNILMEKK